MRKQPSSTVLCQVCRKKKKLADVMPAALIHEPLLGAIRQRHPDWSPNGYICVVDLNQLRTKYFKDVLEQGKGALSELDRQVMDGLKEQGLLSTNINAQFEKQLTLGERLADTIADFGGSWTFIIILCATLALWVVLNSVVALVRPFDPQPFILLNLVLSCIAAMQAPFIMMSQNRQEAKDRLHAEYDYQINLKSELEIRYLHEKLDYLLTNHRQTLLEIQEIRMELLHRPTLKGAPANRSRRNA